MEYKINRYNIPQWLWNYAEETIKKYQYDSSHDLTHFTNVCEYVKQILESDYSEQILIKDISREDSVNILYHAAFSHDLIDSKYLDTKEAIIRLKKLFIDNNYNKDYLDVIIFLIDNMSYSKQRTGKQVIPEDLQLILNIISDADKLDAYRVERVVAFQDHKNKNLNEPERTDTNRSWVKTILVKRVLNYRDLWLKTDYAKKICGSMHDEVEKYVNENLKDVHMYDY